MTATHPMIGLEVPDDGLHRLTTRQEIHLLAAQRALLAPMADRYVWILVVYASMTEVDKHFDRLHAGVLHQHVHLLHLRVHGVSIVVISVELARTHDEVAL